MGQCQFKLPACICAPLAPFVHNKHVRWPHHRKCRLMSTYITVVHHQLLAMQKLGQCPPLLPLWQPSCPSWNGMKSSTRHIPFTTAGQLYWVRSSVAISGSLVLISSGNVPRSMGRDLVRLQTHTTLFLIGFGATARKQQHC